MATAVLSVTPERQPICLYAEGEALRFSHTPPVPPPGRGHPGPEATPDRRTAPGLPSPPPPGTGLLSVGLRQGPGEPLRPPTRAAPWLRPPEAPGGRRAGSPGAEAPEAGAGAPRQPRPPRRARSGGGGRRDPRRRRRARGAAARSLSACGCQAGAAERPRRAWVGQGPGGAAARLRRTGAAAAARRAAASPGRSVRRQPAAGINYKPAFNVSDSLNGIFHSNFVIKIERPFGCDHTSIINCICLRY